jgi:hypothetical protein
VKLIVAPLIKEFQGRFMPSQDPATDPHPEPDEYNLSALYNPHTWYSSVKYACCDPKVPEIYY